MQHEERQRLAQITGPADAELRKCSAIFYDCETISMIPLEGEPRDSSLHYCAGWNDFEGMGISVVTVYDFVTNAYRVFLQDNLPYFGQLFESRNLIIGFNNWRFDDELIAANGIVIRREKSYDMWHHIKTTQIPGHRSGFYLNAMLSCNHLENKSGDGGEAPRLAQRGRWGELINYCLDDTRLSVQLLRLLCSDMLIHPKNGGYMTVPKPWEVTRAQLEPESLF